MKLTDTERQALRKIVAAEGRINANLLTFIGLDELRARLPNQWERNKNRITKAAMAILRQFTDPASDLVLPFGEMFIVLFGNLGTQESLLRAAMIKTEILKRFAGDAVLETLDINVQAVELDSGAVVQGSLAEMLGRLRPSDPAPRPAEPRPSAHQANDREKRAYRASVVDLGMQASTSVQDLEKQFGYDIDELDYAFQPFLLLTKGVFSLFLCRPVRYSATRDILVGYDVLPREADAAQVAALDEMVLLRARHGLVDMAIRKRVSIVALPVSFETMSNRRYSVDYMNLLQKVPSDLRNYLVLSLVRCPEGIPEGRMAELVGSLKRFARAVSVPVTSPAHSLASIKAAGASGTGYDLSKVAGTQMATPAYAARFVQAARKLGLQTYLDGIASPELYQEYRETRPDYMGGRALAEMSDYVGPITESRSVA